MVPQLRNEGFAKENKESSNDNKDINNNYNITETLNSHSDNSICLLVYIECLHKFLNYLSFLMGSG